MILWFFKIFICGHIVVAAILKMTNLKDHIIFQLEDSDFRILREISYKNDSVAKFYSLCPHGLQLARMESRLSCCVTGFQNNQG